MEIGDNTVPTYCPSPSGAGNFNQDFNTGLFIMWLKL